VAQFPHVADQLAMRTQAVAAFLERHHAAVSSLEAVMARGGLLHPVAAGVYAVNDRMLEDSREMRVAEHASYLGALIAHELAAGTSIPCYIADPVSVDEFDDVARISGLKELPRYSFVHALNIRKVAYKTAERHGKSLSDMNMIVAHLGGGISIAALRRGRMVDENDANNGGPYAPERAGCVPACSLVRLCFAPGATERGMRRQLTQQGGLVSHLGTSDAREVRRRVDAKDAQAGLVYEGMAYQIAKHIGGMATVLEGDVDVIVLTGGLAHDDLLMQWISDRVGFIAPVEIVPGENELEALNEAFVRLRQGLETPKAYD
ncbi:MAG TPA: butyrate kinase, partial [Clostridia bacterium]|nr:butyrate kinase [Clostridia bacterium]